MARYVATINGKEVEAESGAMNVWRADRRSFGPAPLIIIGCDRLLLGAIYETATYADERACEFLESLGFTRKEN